MRALITAGLALGAAALVGGCTSYKVLAFSDHSKHPITRLETLRTKDYWFSTSLQHQYWLCQDQGDKLACTRKCGDGTDLECPTASATAGGISTNTR